MYSQWGALQLHAFIKSHIFTASHARNRISTTKSRALRLNVVRMLKSIIPSSEEVVQVYGICIRTLHLPVISIMIIGVMRLSHNERAVSEGRFRDHCSKLCLCERPSLAHSSICDGDVTILLHTLTNFDPCCIQRYKSHVHRS